MTFLAKSLAAPKARRVLRLRNHGGRRTRHIAQTTSVRLRFRHTARAYTNLHPAEFAFEIGSGLLTEVRRLQSLLGERDKAIQDMKEEKDDLEKSVESLRTALRQQEQSSGEHLVRRWHVHSGKLTLG